MLIAANDDSLQAGGLRRQVLKWGITQDLAKRYTQKVLAGGKLIPVTQGSRSLMMTAERWLIQTARGPLNKERIRGIVQTVLQGL